MNSNAGGSWSFSLGRWGGVEVRLHLQFPLLVLVGMLIADLSTQTRVNPLAAPGITYGGVLMTMAVLLMSVSLHEAARMVVARRLGGRTSLIVIGPTGGWTQPYLPPDPPAHLATALVGPFVYLAIAVAAACCLVVYGQHELLPLLSPFAPQFVEPSSHLHMAAQLTVWVNAWLLMVNLLPIHPADGAELLKSVLWPLVGRPSAAATHAHIAFGSAAVALLLAIVLRGVWLSDSMPAWFPLTLLAVALLYGGNRLSRQRKYDVGLAIDEFDSDDEQWLHAEWLEDDRAVVLVEHLQEKQQEALDRKRRERESQEDARVDDILARLTQTSFDQLSEEEQAILKRASRRYRQRRERTD